LSTQGLSVSLEDMRFGYAETSVSFNAAFAAGSVTAVTGPSGSGKTTMLNLIAGFETPHAGRIVLGSEDVTALPPSKRPVSFLFQEHNLFAHMSVHDNAGLGISPSLRLTSADEKRIAESLERVGLSDKGHRLPEQLSGGERQRAALARVLVQRHPVLLLDEPFASLGPSLRQEMTALVAELQAERGMTLLLVTHHPMEAAGIAANICFIDQGQIAALGPPAELLGGNGPEGLRSYLGEQAQIR
jgi:thiamine transport system ATP-binding protein